MNALTFTKTGAKATTTSKLDKNVFEVAPESHALLQHVYVAYLANGRRNLAMTKTRGDVRGGGKKPWRQKGTGRARIGSIRAPQWRGGGIVFGPTGQESYKQHVNAKAKQAALRQSLSMAAAEKRIRVIEAFVCKSGKVTEASSLLAKLETSGHVLIVVADKTDLLQRATNNLPGVKLVRAGYLNAFDVLNADSIVFDQAALDAVTQRLNTEAKPAAKETK